MILVRWTTRAAVLLLAASLAACDARPVTSPVTSPFASLGPGIHPVLVVAEPGAGGTPVELHLKRVGVSGEVASFQGELRYDPAAVRVSAATFPTGAAGVWHQPSPGRLRFAGAAPGGIADGAVLHLTVEGPIEAETFSLAMEEVVSLEGFANVTARVSAGPHPLVVPTAALR